MRTVRLDEENPLHGVESSPAPPPRQETRTPESITWSWKVIRQPVQSFIDIVSGIHYMELKGARSPYWPQYGSLYESITWSWKLCLGLVLGLSLGRRNPLHGVERERALASLEESWWIHYMELKDYLFGMFCLTKRNRWESITWSWKYSLTSFRTDSMRSTLNPLHGVES